MSWGGGSNDQIRLGVCDLLFASAIAQGAGVERVVVTGSRVYNESTVPHIALIKRADFIITRLRVTCDTRDAAQRREEMKTTLRGLMRAAQQSSGMALAVGEDVLTPLTEGMLDDIIVTTNTRADTSEASVVIKSRLSEADSLEAATARIKSFIAKAPKAGRTEVLRGDGWDLTIVDPEQYRDELIKRIAADAKRTAELLGPGYSVGIDGLQNPVAWYQQGPLDLGLYISYKLSVFAVSLPISGT